ncbi:MAG TPA: sugar ABC transporter permease [Thermomicrobiales bacterium]|nr:sugar ABC transporter permease [Thermomicrobiales bacterium]
MGKPMTMEKSISTERLHDARASWRKGAFFRKKVLPWLFVTPILLINITVVLGPALSAGYYSLTDWSGIGAANFIGLDNFRRILLEDSSYKSAFLNNLIWLGLFLTVPIAMALVGASVISPIRRGALFFRLALFVPYVLPSVIVANLWRTLLDPDRGIMGWLTDQGLPGTDIALLGRQNTVLPTIAFIDNWHWWGFLMVLFLAGMQNISRDLYEAARLDGANRWEEFRDVTIPGIRPVLVFMVLMTAIWSFLTFDYIWILTQGGPAGASEVLSVLVYKNAFQAFQAGYASAIGLTMSFFVGIIISIFIVLRRRGWEI